VTTQEGGNNQYNLDDIIAEVKRAAGIAVEDTVTQEIAPAPQPQSAREQAPEPVPVAEQPRQTEPSAPPQDEPCPQLEPQQEPVGRHEKQTPKEPSVVDKILREEERFARERQRAEAEAAARAAALAAAADEEEAEEPAHASAPWRTKRSLFRRAQKETYADDVEEAEEKPPRPRLQYDFINVPYEDAAAAVKALDKKIMSMAARLLLMIPLMVVSTYMTVCMPLGLPMPFGFSYTAYPFYYLLAFCVLQALALLICADVTAAGLWRLVRGRPTLDTLVLFGSLCAMAHTISVIVKPEWGGYLPYSCVAVVTCFFALMAKRQRAQALKRTYKASLLGAAPTAVKVVHLPDGQCMAVKTGDNAYVEPEEFACQDITERVSEFYAPLAMVASVAFAAVASFGRGNGNAFLWALSAIASVTAPGCLLLSSSMPAKKLTKKLFTSGSVLINTARSKALSKCDSVRLTDSDLFSAGSVSINGMKIAGNLKVEKVVGFACAMVQEIDGGLSKAFVDFARRQYYPLYRADDIHFYESGGMTAHIEGCDVMMGSASFLMRMGVRVTEGLKLKNSIFIAIDSVFAGVFSMKYGVHPQPYAAFRLLRHLRLRPWLAVRDFNLTQAFVEKQFDLHRDSTEHPDLQQRVELSEPNVGKEAQTLALLSRDGMLPFTEAIAAAKKMRRAARINLALALSAAVIGMLLMYFLTANLEAASATPYNVLLYLLLWLVPTWLISALITKM